MYEDDEVEVSNNELSYVPSSRSLSIIVTQPINCHLNPTTTTTQPPPRVSKHMYFKSSSSLSQGILEITKHVVFDDHFVFDKTPFPSQQHGESQSVGDISIRA